MSEEMSGKSGTSDAETLEQLEARLAELLAMQAEGKTEGGRAAEAPPAAPRDGVEPIDLYRPVKRPTTVRIDADVLFWLKSAGPGYQTRLNAILREAMMRDLAAFEGEDGDGG